MQGATLNNIVAGVLLLCGLVTTGLVVRRELVSVPLETSESEPTFIKDWEEALDQGIRIGPVSAPVQIVEFADFQCPYCARFEQRVSEVRQRHGDNVSVIFVHSPLSSHDLAERAARAAECAHVQGEFMAMKTVLFERQALLGTASWIELAQHAKVPDTALFQACLDSTEPVERIAQGKRLTTKFGLRGTPSILVDGWLLPRPPSTDELDGIVREVLKGGTPKLK